MSKRWTRFVATWCLVGAVSVWFGLHDVQAADKAKSDASAKPASVTQGADQPAKTDESAQAAESEPQAADKPVKIESSNPYSGQPDAIQSGGELYFKFCVQCHGKKADGVSPRWGKYAKDLRVFWQGYSKFVAIVVTGIPKKQMPAWGPYLSGEQISHIGAYLETLAMEGANWK